MNKCVRGHFFKTSLAQAAGFCVWVCGVQSSAAATDDAAFGTLVLQSPVQAVATLNGEGAFLVIPGKDLRWSQIRPGTYKISMTSGTQQWKQSAEVKAGQTETLVAVLASPGAPLSATALPPPPAIVPVLPADLSPSDPTISTLPQPEQQKEDTSSLADERRRQQEQLLREREDREAELRAEREAQCQEQEIQAEQEKSRKPKRPKVH